MMDLVALGHVGNVPPATDYIIALDNKTSGLCTQMLKDVFFRTNVTFLSHFLLNDF